MLDPLTLSVGVFSKDAEIEDCWKLLFSSSSEISTGLPSKLLA